MWQVGSTARRLVSACEQTNDGSIMCTYCAGSVDGFKILHKTRLELGWCVLQLNPVDA